MDSERRNQGAYEPIPSAKDELRKAVGDFILNRTGRGDLLKKHGPLCLWDVSAIEDFTAACWVNFSSDLFWDTRSARTMVDMFLRNSTFKGHIGTWDVSKVTTMMGMFTWAGIKDSGIGSWSTSSLSNCSFMFRGALGLSKDLDLSRWRFGASPDMTCMFWDSGIVDCGIGNWDVSGARAENMLKGTNKFTGFMSLKPPKWPTSDDNNKVLQANVPEARRKSFVPAAFGGTY